MRKAKIEVNNRDIAKMLCKAMPIEAEDFRAKVEAYMLVIKKLKPAQRLAMKAAYIFSSKVPREEREDMFQELALALLRKDTNEEKLAYSIARMDWVDWWRKYKVRSQYNGGSLNAEVKDNDGNAVELGELLVGEVEFEAKIVGELDGQKLWQSLPAKIKPIIQRRLIGKGLCDRDRQVLSRWIRKEGYQLLLA